ERLRLATALKGIAAGIEHYGSTAVPGLRAKPNLDHLAGVTPTDRWAERPGTLLGHGYDYAQRAGVPGHFIFGRGRDRSERTHLVHVVEFGGESWVSNLAFRDALRIDADLRQRYSDIKSAAIAGAPEGRAAYNELKGEAIARIKDELGRS